MSNLPKTVQVHPDTALQSQDLNWTRSGHLALGLWHVGEASRSQKNCEKHFEMTAALFPVTGQLTSSGIASPVVIIPNSPSQVWLSEGFLSPRPEVGKEAQRHSARTLARQRN